MKALRILVVDDASFIRDLIKRSIKERFGGFQIDDAINGNYVEPDEDEPADDFELLDD